MVETCYWRLLRALQLLLFAAFLLIPSIVFADCGPAPNNGWGANYQSYASWCIQCGGRPYNNNGVGCDMKGASSGSSAVTGSSYQAPATTVEGAVLQGVQNGIQQGLRNAAEQQRRQQIENDQSAQRMAQDNAMLENNAIENARILKEKNETSEAKAKQMQAQHANEILSQMRGGFNTATSTQPAPVAQGESLRLKDLTKTLDSGPGRCIREAGFKTYQLREADRRKVLEKLSSYSTQNQSVKERVYWCKTNIPLPPSPSSADYCQKKPAYEARMRDWREKCAVVTEEAIALPLPAPDDSSMKGSKPGSAPYCLGVYDGEAKSCSTEDLIILNECINKAISSFIHCLNFDNPDKGITVPKQRKSESSDDAGPIR
jgi:hypothetical protein